MSSQFLAIREHSISLNYQRLQEQVEEILHHKIKFERKYNRLSLGMTYDVRVEYIVLPLGSDDEVISGFFKVEK